MVIWVIKLWRRRKRQWLINSIVRSCRLSDALGKSSYDYKKDLPGGVEHDVVNALKAIGFSWARSRCLSGNGGRGTDVFWVFSWS